MMQFRRLTKTHLDAQANVIGDWPALLQSVHLHLPAVMQSIHVLNTACRRILISDTSHVTTIKAGHTETCLASPNKQIVEIGVHILNAQHTLCWADTYHPSVEKNVWHDRDLHAALRCAHMCCFPCGCNCEMCDSNCFGIYLCVAQTAGNSRSGV